MIQSKVIQPLTTHHASTIAKIHVASQSDTFLTSLGQDFLTTLYSQISRSDYSDSYVAIKNNEVVGFIVTALHTRKLFQDVVFNAPFRLSWLVFKQALRRPVLLWQAAKTLAYPSQGVYDLPEAELLALAVDTNWRNKKIGSQLVQHLLCSIQAAGVVEIVVTVEGNNKGALRFYQRHGFVPISNFKMYGRPMCHLVLTLDTTED